MRFALCLFICMNFGLAETVTLSADIYPPFNATPGPKPGLMIEVAQTVFAKSNINIEYKPLPWSRTLKLVESGEVDGAVGADPTMAQDFSLPSEPQAWWEPHFFTLATKTWTYHDLTNLADQKLGVVQDYSYGKSTAGEDLDAYIAARKNVESLKGDKPIETLLGMLQRERIDCMIESPAVIHATLEALHLTGEVVRDAGAFSKGYGLFIAFGKSDRGRHLAKLLGEGTSELRRTGELQAILERYQLKDWLAR